MSTVAMVAKTGMAALLGATIPVDGPQELWLQWGLAGVVVAFVMWRDHQREKRLSQVIEQQEAWMRDALVNSLAQNTAALNEVTHALRHQRHADYHPDAL